MNRLTPALVLAATLGAGCATAPPWVSPEEHQRLVRQQLELERRAAQAELEIERLKRRIALLEGGAPGAAGTTAPAPRVSESNAPPRHDAEPVAGWRGASGTVEESELAELETVASAAASPQAVSGYERGLVLLRDGDPIAAEAAFRSFLDGGASGDLGDNAWFWIGESRLARGDATGAIAAYRQCLEQYPEGNKVPDAMLKLGQAFAETGDAASAREVWSELVQRFPSTAAAERASSRLALP